MTTSTHVHDWQPIPLACGRYSCACGEIGRRSQGAIKPVTSSTTKQHWRAHIDDTRENVVTVRTERDGGPVARAPMLHEVEKRR